MAESRIPVDLFNPGQVFACLGFLEAAEVLLGEAEGGFDWSEPGDVRFVLRASGEADPVAEVLRFVAKAQLRRTAPANHDDRSPKEKKHAADEAKKYGRPMPPPPPMPTDVEVTDFFPEPVSDRMSLPIRLHSGDFRPIDLTHWADGSGRDRLKLYAGNRSAFDIAEEMLGCLVRLHAAEQNGLAASPFGVTSEMGGSFNFDPRGAWTALDVGYSLNDQKHRVDASPVVELLAAWGLENARPREIGLRRYRYAVWDTSLPPMLARPTVAGALDVLVKRSFVFRLSLSGKNKVMTYAEEDTPR
jgi:CRISPR-associated protein Csx14